VTQLPKTPGQRLNFPKQSTFLWQPLKCVGVPLQLNL
jgi:hypothetical protein